MASTERDMVYAGKVMTRWIKAHYKSPYGLMEKRGFPSSTTYAIIGGTRYPADHVNVERLEVALGWPLGTVGLLAAHDFDGMERAGCPAGLIRLAKSLVPQREERRNSNRGAS